MTTLAHPLDWTPALDSPEPFFCPRCWTDFHDTLISSDELLRTISHPFRRWTRWCCPRCTMAPYDDDEPMHAESERIAALADIRAHIAMWAGTTATYERELARDDF